MGEKDNGIPGILDAAGGSIMGTALGSSSKTLRYPTARNNAFVFWNTAASVNLVIMQIMAILEMRYVTPISPWQWLLWVGISTAVYLFFAARGYMYTAEFFDASTNRVHVGRDREAVLSTDQMQEHDSHALYILSVHLIVLGLMWDLHNRISSTAYTNLTDNRNDLAAYGAIDLPHQEWHNIMTGLAFTGVLNAYTFFMSLHRTTSLRVVFKKAMSAVRGNIRGYGAGII